MTKRILVVEDDRSLARMLCDALEGEGYHVDWSPDGCAFLGDAAAYDVILMDVGLPGRDGVELCRELRRRGVETPVLMVTGKSDSPTKVKALRQGADDYLTKPFQGEELLARVWALLRRRLVLETASLTRCTVGETVIDFSRSRATRRGDPVNLSQKELQLLRYLVARTGMVVSREELLLEVWGYASNNTRTVDATLRQKLQDDSHNAQLITVRGRGYLFRNLSAPECKEHFTEGDGTELAANCSNTAGGENT